MLKSIIRGATWVSKPLLFGFSIYFFSPLAFAQSTKFASTPLLGGREWERHLEGALEFTNEVSSSYKTFEAPAGSLRDALGVGVRGRFWWGPWAGADFSYRYLYRGLDGVKPGASSRLGSEYTKIIFPVRFAWDREHYLAPFVGWIQRYYGDAEGRLINSTSVEWLERVNTWPLGLQLHLALLGFGLHVEGYLSLADSVKGNGLSRDGTEFSSVNWLARAEWALQTTEYVQSVVGLTFEQNFHFWKQSGAQRLLGFHSMSLSTGTRF